MTAILDAAIELSRNVVDGVYSTGGLLYLGMAVEALGELLLRRGEADDLAEAGAAIERLAAVPTDPGFVLHELPLLRLRALLAAARQDEPGSARYAKDYAALANSLGFAGRRVQADAMP